MQIEHTTLSGNYSQRLHFITHHYGIDADIRMTINENGYVGIGTTTSVFPLHIPTTVGHNAGGYFLHYYHGGILYTDNVTWGISIKAHAIFVNDFVMASDERIKTNVEEIVDN